MTNHEEIGDIYVSSKPAAAPAAPAAPAADRAEHQLKTRSIVGRPQSRLGDKVVAVLLGALLVVEILNLAAASSDWEYRIESPSDNRFDREMDVLGDDGWELVTARRASNSSGDMAYEMIFKRRRR